MTNVISGRAWQCKKQKIKTSRYLTFLRNEEKTVEITNMELSREDCYDMVVTKRCEHERMDCNGDNCLYNKDPEIQFQWLKPNNYISYKCYYCKTSISQDNRW